MKTFYSAKSGGFYPEELLDAYVQNGVMPLDLVEIDGETYEHCMSAPGRGQYVAAGDDGRPLCVPLPGPSEGEIIQAARKERDERLSKAAQRIAPLQDAVDIGIATDSEEGQLLEWKRYRVALSRMDIDAGDVEWPDEPESVTA